MDTSQIWDKSGLVATKVVCDNIFNIEDDKYLTIAEADIRYVNYDEGENFIYDFTPDSDNVIILNLENASDSFIAPVTRMDCF